MGRANAKHPPRDRESDEEDGPPFKMPPFKMPRHDEPRHGLTDSATAPPSLSSVPSAEHHAELAACLRVRLQQAEAAAACAIEAAASARAAAGTAAAAGATAASAAAASGSANLTGTEYVGKSPNGEKVDVHFAFATSTKHKSVTA